MVRLTRAIKLAVDVEQRQLVRARRGDMSLAMVPVTLWVTLEGQVDPAKAMLVNVTEIDQAVREMVDSANIEAPNAPAALAGLRRQCGGELVGCKVLRLGLEMSDSSKVVSDSEDWEMIEVTTKYELAASHRLGRGDWDAEKNFEVFGRCSNPAGHGHNYSLEITLRGRVNADSGVLMDQEEVDAIVTERVLDRFDHKNLNEDTEEFRELIPTVENMAKVFWELLVGKFSEVQLARVAVWETAKSCAEYFGPGAGLRYGDTV